MNNKKISKINISALQNINEYFEGKVNQNTTSREKLSVEAKFDNYDALLYDIKVILKIITDLSMNSNSDDKHTLEYINVLSGLVQKILPVFDVSFLDRLLLSDVYSKSENFVSLLEVDEKIK